MINSFESILSQYIWSKNIPNFYNEVVKKIGWSIFFENFDDEKSYEVFSDQLFNKKLLSSKYSDLVRFYYFWCFEPSRNKDLKQDYKLIVIFSTIEALLSDDDFISLNNWLNSKEIRGDISINSESDLSNALCIYHEKYGTNRKIKNFFNTYTDKFHLEKLASGLKKVNLESGTEQYGIDELIAFIETIRNLFIHKATHIQIKSLKELNPQLINNPYYASELLTYVGGNVVEIDNNKVNIEAIISAFENGFINFFRTKL